MNESGKILNNLTIINSTKRKDHELDDVALLLFTSGSTSIPKCVMLTYSNVFSNLEEIINYSELQETDKVLISRPLSNVSAITGEILLSLIKGCSMFVKERNISPLYLRKIINEKSITTLFTTPTIATYLARISTNLKVPSLKNIILSGESLKELQLKEIEKLGDDISIWNVYGLTEASPRISYNKNISISNNCVGKPLGNIKIKIIDTQSGKDLNNGGEGELLVNGPNIMKGYYGDPIATKSKIKNGWLFTGDIAKIINGQLYILGRKDWLIIRGGENINPIEVESIFENIPGIQECMAFKVEKDLKSELNVWIVTNSVITKSSIYKYLSEKRIDNYLWPDNIFIKNELPKLPNGKLARPKG